MLAQMIALMLAQTIALVLAYERTGKAIKGAMMETGVADHAENNAPSKPAGPGDGEQVIGDEISRFGLHSLHVICMGAAVDAQRWLESLYATEQIKGHALACVTTFSYEDVDVSGLWHFRLWWKDGDYGSKSVE